ncbi:MAG TPA: hypothetical protein VFX19_09600 [Dehalococcoidia bacterium]|nr:hypothetical protein [Dehalococcoidia bacterium]
MGTVREKLHTLFFYPFLLLSISLLDSQTFWQIFTVLVCLLIFLYVRMPNRDWQAWQEGHGAWLQRDDVFAATLVVAVGVTGTVIGTAEGHVLRGLIGGLVWGAVLVGLHYVLYGDWKRRIFGS